MAPHGSHLAPATASRPSLLLLFCAAAAAAATPGGASAGTFSFDAVVTSPNKPMHTVEPYYVSFALDNAFVRDPGVLPPDQTNSLRTVVPLVSGGLLRVGGTYTDFIHYYVPGNNYTKCPYQNMTRPGAECPGNSFPCCLPLPVDRWAELLSFGNATGIKIGFNLNLLHGRWEQYTAAVKDRSKKPTPAELNPWDSSNARALMEWTVANVPSEHWPVAFGLGNELAWFISPETWARDVETLSGMVKDIFPPGHVPQVYAPCNANGDSVGWGGQFLDALRNGTPSTALSAYTFHGYQHGGATVDDVVNGIQGAGIDSSRAFYKTIAAVHAEHSPPGAKLWITETAYSASAPANAQHGGGAADVPAAGMLRASDMPWYITALGGAAEVGVDVFCKETLAGDWLETIGLWQPAGLPAYTPHPDFWVSALWNKVMGTRALGANATATGAPPPPPPRSGWIVEQGESNSYQQCGLNGSKTIPYLGTVATAKECQAKCAAVPGCSSFSWDSAPAGSAGGWGHRCFGRLDGVWAPVAVGSVVSGCDPEMIASCRAAAPAVRVFAHCSRRKPSTVAFAFGSVAPPDGPGGNTVALRFPGATEVTKYVLTAASPSDDFASLNGARLSASPGAPPALDGESATGDTVTVPLGAVGFVETDVAVPACAQ